MNKAILALLVISITKFEAEKELGEIPVIKEKKFGAVTRRHAGIAITALCWHLT